MSRVVSDKVFRVLSVWMYENDENDGKHEKNFDVEHIA